MFCQMEKQEEKLDDSRNDVKAKEYGWSLNEGGMQAARFLVRRPSPG